LLDEIGRGTAPNDGVAISYATAKWLIAKGSRVQFATHLHTVCDMLWHERDGKAVDFKQTKAGVDGVRC
jgi:DNA mismatch repair ATPase MutS